MFALLLPPRKRKYKVAVPKKSQEETDGGGSVELPYGWKKVADDQTSGCGGRGHVK